MIGIVDITASKKLNRQAIVTKFLLIIVPIFPTGHYFIDKNNSAEYKAKTCRENILKGFLYSSLPFVLFILFLLWDTFNIPIIPIFTVWYYFADCECGFPEI